MATHSAVEGYDGPSDTSDTDSNSSGDSAMLPPPKQCCGCAVLAVCGGALLMAVALAALLMHGNEKHTAMADVTIPDFEGPFVNFAGALDSKSQQLRDVLPRKPLRENFRKWGGSVAVVASGPSLIDSGFGALIDSHDIVMRFNYAPSKGYEGDVGARTDIRVMALNHMFWEDERERSIHRITMDKYFRRDLELMPQLDNPTTNRLYTFSERFLDLMYEFGGVEGNPCPPSTGFVAVMFAMYEFKNVSLFGFVTQNYNQAALKGAYHYYNSTANFHGPVTAFHERYHLTAGGDWDVVTNEDKKGLTIEHDMTHEHEMYDQFARQGRLVRY